jgi:hypothetical protein
MRPQPKDGNWLDGDSGYLSCVTNTKLNKNGSALWLPKLRGTVEGSTEGRTHASSENVSGPTLSYRTTNLHSPPKPSFQKENCNLRPLTYNQSRPVHGGVDMATHRNGAAKRLMCSLAGGAALMGCVYDPYYPYYGAYYPGVNYPARVTETTATNTAATTTITTVAPPRYYYPYPYYYPYGYYYPYRYVGPPISLNFGYYHYSGHGHGGGHGWNGGGHGWHGGGGGHWGGGHGGGHGHR